MLWRYSLVLGFVLIWASVIVISYGTHLKAFSPNLQEYEQHRMKIMAANGLVGPGAGIALAAESFWPFVAVCYAVIGLLFFFGLLILRSIMGWNRDLALVASGVFLCGCFVGSLLGIREAIDKFRWSFFVLGVGYLLATAGLFFGAIGAVGCCLRHRYDRLRSPVPPSADYRIRL